MTLLAFLNTPVHAWTPIDVLRFVIVLAGVLGITYIVVRVCGITIPKWFWQIAMIVLAVVIGLLAIGFITAM
jgi:hypothetical protein